MAHDSSISTLFLSLALRSAITSPVRFPTTPARCQLSPFSAIYCHPPVILTFPPRQIKRPVIGCADSWSDELESLLPTSQDSESGYAVIQLAQRRVRSSRKSV